ncbi:hypothetical protein ABT297_18825 [Dactylosporangium sp. NPDC000555]|uniref:hypothetical protein n=1 Tax=Dactylosporangium sp. NPDC000555 TaxID=3154260 RepID=UPI00332B3EF4
MSEQGFTVDSQAVHGFGTELRRDLDVHLSSEKLQTLHIFAGLPTFGARTASPAVQQAARDYHARLLELYEVMDALLYNGEVMARAAHTIADAYATADTLSGEDITTVLRGAKEAVAADAAAVDPSTRRPI